MPSSDPLPKRSQFSTDSPRVSHPDQGAGCAWIEQAAFDGLPEAQILLGLFHEGGLLAPFLPDYGLAKSWYLTADASGNAQAKFHLYRLVYGGTPALGSLCMGQTCLGLAAAAEDGHGLAQYELGQRCESGTVDDGVCPDARYWYGMAAEGGLAAAHEALGRVALKQLLDEPRAEVWARAHFLNAACLGDELAEARVLGIDPKEIFDAERWRDAEAWCHTLARNDDHPIAAWQLTKIYARGLAGERDEAQAAFWLLRAASLGHAVAQYTVGSRYERGDGTPADLNAAHQWYHQAVEQVYLPALITEARLIESGGLRCWHDLHEALDLYRRACPRSLVARARYVRLLRHMKSDGRVPLSAMPMPSWLCSDDQWIIDRWLSDASEVERDP